jgi:hypothetical protein
MRGENKERNGAGLRRNETRKLVATSIAADRMKLATGR